MLQALFILKYKNLNCQTSIGRGYNGRSSSTPKTVGSTAMKGMDYGTTSNASVKFLGIEDMWGHMWQWTENLHFDTTLKATLDGPGA
jgi:hypothetical protein